MRKHKLIKYDHIVDDKSTRSYQIDLQSNEVKFVNAGFLKHPSRFFLNPQDGIIETSYAKGLRSDKNTLYEV